MQPNGTCEDVMSSKLDSDMAEAVEAMIRRSVSRARRRILECRVIVVISFGRLCRIDLFLFKTL